MTNIINSNNPQIYVADKLDNNNKTKSNKLKNFYKLLKTIIF